MSNPLIDHLTADDPMTAMAYDEDGMPSQVADRFRVEGPKQAEWALLKLRKIRAEIAANTALANDEIARIEAWEAEVNKPLSASADFFTGLLTEYHRNIITAEIEEGVEDKRLTKSIKLPAGTLKSRVTPPKLVVEDEAAALEWARQHAHDLVNVVETINKAAAKKAVLETGEAVPGLAVVPGERGFVVEVADV